MFLTSEASEIMRNTKNKKVLLLSHASLGSLSDYALLSYEDAFFNYYYGFDSYLVSYYKEIKTVIKEYMSSNLRANYV